MHMKSLSDPYKSCSQCLTFLPYCLFVYNAAKIGNSCHIMVYMHVLPHMRMLAHTRMGHIVMSHTRMGVRYEYTWLNDCV